MDRCTTWCRTSPASPPTRSTGRLGGVPSDEQTAAQVEQRRGQPTTVVLREWERSASQFELVLTKAGPSILPAAIDVAVHEHDIRGALDLPGAHQSETITITAHRMLDRWMRSLPAATWCCRASSTRPERCSPATRARP